MLPECTIFSQLWLSVNHFTVVSCNSFLKDANANSMAFNSLHVELIFFSSSFHIKWNTLELTSTVYALDAELLASE